METSQEQTEYQPRTGEILTKKYTKGRGRTIRKYRNRAMKMRFPPTYTDGVSGKRRQQSSWLQVFEKCECKQRVAKGGTYGKKNNCRCQSRIYGIPHGMRTDAGGYGC